LSEGMGAWLNWLVGSEQGEVRVRLGHEIRNSF
jgi:hypothetical protein